MESYGVADVERLLGLPRRTIRALVDAGFVTPARGPRNALRFSFQDLIVLRTARALTEANVPHRRIATSLRALRAKLPDSMPLSGLAIDAVGARVVVRERGRQWQAESGQYLLAFAPGGADRPITVIEPPATSAQKPAARSDQRGAIDAYERAIALVDANDLAAAERAFRATVAADPCHLDARIELGRILHESDRLEEAEAQYREGLARCGTDAVLWFNLGVVLEDRGHALDSAEAYRASIDADPRLADAHYNLALVYESLDRPRDAIRHMASYRRLTRKGGGGSN
ncbi:MAG TPA: tetratricopeptide repeat protein [Candidatus Saccharimonadia bacterium]|nr:tetratricopeptide repeat protein [Candidatus Saccharimonadia bacterium]